MPFPVMKEEQGSGEERVDEEGEDEKASAGGKEADTGDYEVAGFYSQQAANYSVVYDVWCD